MACVMHGSRSNSLIHLCSLTRQAATTKKKKMGLVGLVVGDTGHGLSRGRSELFARSEKFITASTKVSRVTAEGADEISLQITSQVEGGGRRGRGIPH